MLGMLLKRSCYEVEKLHFSYILYENHSKLQEKTYYNIPN